MSTPHDTAGSGLVSGAGADPGVAHLIVALARAVHQVGQPAHRVEETLSLAAKRLGVDLVVFCLPTGLIISFSTGVGPVTHVIRESPNAVNLERLVQVTAIADEIIRGSVLPGAATSRIEQIMSAPSRWSGFALAAAYVLSAGAFSVFFGGGSTELLVSICVGFAVGATAVAMRRVRVASRLFELTAAFAAAFLAESADWILGSFVDWVPLAAGLIILLPGMSLFDSVDELANGHVAAGGSRMAGVAVAFLALAFGAGLGFRVAEFLPGDRHLFDSTPLPDWSIVPALICVTAGSTIRFRARPRDAAPILLASVVAVAGSQWGAIAAGPHAGPFLAALLLGVASNLYARILRVAPELLVTPGLALLVPGSIGVRSISALFSQDVLAGVNTAFDMFIIAMALVAGLLFSNSLVRERTPG